MAKAIQLTESASWIKELESSLKNHLTQSDDQDLINTIHALTPPSSLLDIKEFENNEHIAKHMRQTLSLSLLEELEENGPSLITDWALGWLKFPGLLLPINRAQSTKQLVLVQKFYCTFIARLLSRLKTQASTNADGMRWLFTLTDQWRLDYEGMTKIGFKKAASIRIPIAEPNIYAQEDEVGYLHLMNIFSAFQTGQLSAIPWRKLKPQEQFGGYLFFVICLSGVTYSQLKIIANMSLMKKSFDLPFSSLLLPLDSSLKLADVYDLNKLKSGENQTYRWIPDPVSASLHHRLRKGWVFESPKSGFYSQCIQDFLTSLKNTFRIQSASSKSDLHGGQINLLNNALNHFSNTSSLILASRAYQRRSLPAFIWHRLERDYDTKDLGFTSLNRLNSITLSQEGIPRQSVNISEEFIEPMVFDKLVKMGDDQNHWTESCLAIVKDYVEGRLELLAALALIEKRKMELELGAEALFTLLASWMQWIIENVNENNKSTLEYPAALLPPMVQIYDIYADFKDLDAESRIDEFDVLETESQYNKTNQEKLRRAWNSFHTYLIQIGHIDASQFTSIKMDSKLSRVGSAYISEPEFQLAREVLYSNTEHPLEFRNICLIILTLSYRLGLRRSEVSKLSTDHVSFLSGKIQNLSIQWWSERSLKSPSSTRIIPLNGLLSEREGLWLALMATARSRGLWISEDILHATALELNEQIKKYIDLSPVGSKGFLFLSDEFLNQGQKATVAVDRIIKFIHEALRAPGSSSADLRFHHLRHSCATNTLLLLMGKHLPNSEKYTFNTIYGNTAAINQLNRLQRKPLALDYLDPETRKKNFELRSTFARKHLLLSDDSSGADVYAVSRLLGHSSPMTTLTSYIHVIDLLVGAFLNERFCKFNERLKLAIHADFKPQLTDRIKSLKDENVGTTLLDKKVVGRPRRMPKVISLKQTLS